MILGSMHSCGGNILLSPAVQLMQYFTPQASDVCCAERFQELDPPLHLQMVSKALCCTGLR